MPRLFQDLEYFLNWIATRGVRIIYYTDEIRRLFYFILFSFIYYCIICRGFSGGLYATDMNWLTHIRLRVRITNNMNR